MSTVVYDTTAFPIGDNRFSVRFNGDSFAEINPSIASSIRSSFSIDLWFNLASQNGYHPIISHNSNGGWNAYTDFNLQINSDGKLSFFMGNGLNTVYGISIVGPTVQIDTWYHVAVAVESEEQYPITPIRARIYLNGEIVGEQDWQGGERINPSDSIVIGKFDNSDPGVQYFEGKIDEVRIWKSFRFPSQVKFSKNHNLTPFETQDLLANFRFEDGSGVELYDSHGEYHGIIQGSFNWITAEVPYNGFVTILSSSKEPTVFVLPASSTHFNYTITSLPQTGYLFSVSEDNYNVLQRIARVPTTLSNNVVAYLPLFYVGDGEDILSYEVQDKSNTYQSTVTLNIISESTCDGIAGSVVDYCGICSGDNSSCTCTWGAGFYKGYEFSELDKIMAFYTAETTLEILKNLKNALHSVDEGLDNCREKRFTDLRIGESVNILHNTQVCLDESLLLIHEKILPKFSN